MKKLILRAGLFTALSTMSFAALASESTKLISQETAIKAALNELGVEVLGIRFDEPDTQWDVFVKNSEKAFEVEVDAKTGEIVASEEESLKEIQAELSGDLSHEGVIGDVDK